MPDAGTAAAGAVQNLSSLDDALKINGDMAPETAYAMGKDSNLDGATMGHSSRFMDMYGKVKDASGELAKETKDSPGFFSFHTLGAIADTVKGGVNDASQFTKNFTYDLPGAISNFAKGAYSEANNIANRATTTASELLSGGGAAWKPTGGFGSLQGEDGHAPTVDWKNLGEEGYNALKIGATRPWDLATNPGVILPQSNLSQEMQSQTATLDEAYAKYKAAPTPDNETALQAQYNQYKSLDVAYKANGNLEDAVNTLHNASPANLLFGKDNVFFMMAHTAAYTESLAAKKGWAYALAQVTPAVAVAILTDGAMSEEVGVGTETYDSNLISQAERLEAAGKDLEPEQVTAVREALERQNARDLIKKAQNNSVDVDPETGALTVGDATLRAQAKLADTLKNAGAVRRGIYNASDAVGNVVSPAFRIARGLMAPASDVRMNLIYQSTQFAALGNPDDAALWNKTANLQAVGANGQEEGQDGTALLNMMNLDPKSMWFSPLSDVADLVDFTTKWLGSDPFGAVGKIVGRARSAEGLSGTLGKWFSGLRITDIDSAATAAKQYPRVMSAFEAMARTDSAAEIKDRFLGTYTDRQALQLARLKTVDEVVQWHGNMAAAGELAKPLAPTFSAFDALKQELHNRLGDVLHLNGQLTPQDANFLLQLGTPEQLEHVGLSQEGMGSLSADPDVEITSTRNFGRFLGTRLGRNPANAVDLLERSSGYMNPLSEDFARRLMDLSRIALLPEKFVKAIGEVAIESDAAERVQMYYKVAAQIAERRMWGGVDEALVSTLKPTVDNYVWNEVLNMAGHDGGGAVERAQMVAGEDGALMTRTYDPENPGRDPKASAVREGQTGHLKLFRPNELRGLAVYTRGIVNDMPKKLVSDARFYQAATDSLKKVAEDTGATLDVASDRIHDLTNNIPSDLKRYEIGGYRDSLRTIQDQIKARSKDAATEVDNFTNVFESLRDSLHNTKFLDSINTERHMVENSSLPKEVKAARLQELDGQIPPEFGIKSLTDINSGTERRLYGQIRALEDMGRTFTNQLSIHDTGSFDELQRVSEDYNKYVLNKPNAAKDLDREWAQRFAALKNSRPDFLNRYYSTIGKLNLLLNRLWVPAALFSGAWAFHISVSEQALNSLRNGFLQTYDSELAARIAKHAVANPTDSYFGGMVSDVANKVKDFRVNDPEFDHDEGGLVAKVASKALSGAYNILRDFTAGSTMGFERLLLSGMDEAQRARMIGDFVDFIVMDDGHIPLRINHVSSTFQGENMDKAMKQKVYGVDQYGNPNESNVFVNGKWEQIGANDAGYSSALSNWMRQISQDNVEGPIAKALYRRIYAEGTRGLSKDAFDNMLNVEILDRGAQSFRSEEAWQKLTEDVKGDARAHIASLPEELRNRMIRNKELMNEEMTEKGADGVPLNDPNADWAKASTYDVMSTVSGKTDPFRGENEHVIHASLLHQVATNQVKDGAELRADISAMNRGEEPSHIPTREMSDRHFSRSGLEKLHFMNTVSDYGHHYVFGPIANSLVRDPLYLLTAHQEMEELRAIYGPRLSETEMQTLASTRATQKMIRFVHNPLDKMVIEQNLRVVAPFYFAQNQALRRSMRLFYSDPGAFEKYLKLSLGVTNWIASDTKNGESPFIYLPGSDVIGKIASFPARIMGKAASNFMFDSSQFALEGSTGSVSSMFPTGAINSVSGIAGNLIRPSGGPFENLSAEAIEALLAHVPWTSTQVNRYVKNVLDFIQGPENVGSSAGYQVNPSSVFRAFEEAGLAAGEWAGIANPNPNNKAMSSLTNSDTVLSSLLLTMNNAADTAYKGYVNEFLTKFQKENHLTNEQMRAEMSNGKVAREVSGWAAGQFATYLQNHQQSFISSALQTNTVLLAQKVVAAIFSPLSPDVEGNFSKSQDFDNMLTEKDSDGKYKYTYDEAKAAFEAKYPDNLTDLAARSMNTKGPWPETKGTLDFIKAHPRIVSEYPWAAAYVQNRDEKYYGPSFDTLIANGLRERDTPEQFVQQMLITSGEQYYREVLTNKYPNDEAGWSQLKEAAVTYGQTSNPTWLSYHQGSAYGHTQSESLDQMSKMVNDKTVPNSVFGGASNRKDFNTLVQMTQSAIAQYHTASSNSERENLAASWYAGIQKMITNPAKYNVPPIAVTFLQDVMQNSLEHLDG